MQLQNVVDYKGRISWNSVLTTGTGVYIIAFLILSTYAQTSSIFFASPDDPWMLLKNDKVTLNLDLKYFLAVFDPTGEIQYSPLNTVYYTIVYKINGFDPYYFHLGSILLHGINCSLVYFSIKKLLAYFQISNAKVIAYLVVLIWSVHPLNVESVVWISATKVLLFSLFTLLSLLSFLRGIERKKWWSFFVSSIWYLCACLCKEQAIVIPAVHAALLLCSKKNWRFPKPVQQTVYFFIPAIIVFVFIAVLNISMNSNNNFPTPINKYSLWETIVLCFYCLRFYITSVLFPINLHFHYKYPFLPSQGAGLINSIFPFVFIGFLTFVLNKIRRSAYLAFYLFCLLTFFFHIGLVLQIIPLTRHTIMADRYMYVPLLFLLLPLTVFSVSLTKNWTRKKLHYVIIVGLVACVFATYSIRLVTNWTENNLANYGKY